MRILVAALTLFASTAWACINTVEENLLVEAMKPGREFLLEKKTELEMKYRSDRSVPIMNDYAVVLLLLGDKERAIEVLEKLEAEHPGEFRTAANLGTAYELGGKNELALRWIKEGVKRNPADHLGTEWLHVKILEAKLATGADPRWMEEHTVLGTDLRGALFKRELLVLPKDFEGKERSFEEIETAITYQLKERLKFVSPPDPFVADLFMAWGDVLRLLKSGNPETPYREAAQYGVASPLGLHWRVQDLSYENGMAAGKVEANRRAGPILYALIASFALNLLFAGVIGWSRFRKPK